MGWSKPALLSGDARPVCEIMEYGVEDSPHAQRPGNQIRMIDPMRQCHQE
jgi:hypothetical protein